MDITEKLEIAKELQNHHYFFRAFWDIGEFVIGKFPDLPTAGIAFDEKGESVNLLINEDFWNSLNEKTRLFLICHEMMHVVLQHGLRFVEHMQDSASMQTMNVAADVVINEMLCKSFGFDRSELDDRLKNDGCWFDTIFNRPEFHNQTIMKDESTEYYFNILKKNLLKMPNVFSIDSHNVLTSEQIEKLENLLESNGVMDALDDKFINSVNGSDRKELKSRSPYGTGTWHTVKVKSTKKKKWETVIKKWESIHSKEDIFSFERWERVNPRYSNIITPNIHLPTEAKVVDEYKTANKIDVFFFLDTSGSCIGLKDRFFNAANSLDKKKFNIRLFCFDTQVVETTLKSGKIWGGGGTLFNIIENKIQDITQKEKIQYPKAVFLITDGYGSSVNPQFPKRWYWFLSSNYTQYIHKESKIYRLSDFE